MQMAYCADCCPCCVCSSATPAKATSGTTIDERRKKYGRKTSNARIRMVTTTRREKMKKKSLYQITIQIDIITGEVSAANRFNSTARVK